MTDRNVHQPQRSSPAVPQASPTSVPQPPPLPVPRPLQRARNVANRFFGLSARDPPSEANDRLILGSIARHAFLGATQDATTSHKTGLEINTIAINEKGTHALVGGNEIFKTVKVEDGTCAEDVNLRASIRRTATQASGSARHNYSVVIADVAWAKGTTGDLVAAATSSGKIVVYDLVHAGMPAAQLHEHFRQVHKVTFNPHRGSLLLSGSQDGTVRLWDVRDVRSASNLQSRHKYRGANDGVRDVKWSPTDGFDFALGTDSGWIQRWDMRNLNTPKLRYAAHSKTCTAVDWHPDGQFIASASADNTVRIWDFSAAGAAGRRNKAVWELKTPYPVSNARWRPTCESPSNSGMRQGTQLVTSYDPEHPIVHIWDLRRPSLPFRDLAPYSTAPTDLLWHSQDLLWTVGREGTFCQSDIQYVPKTMDKRCLTVASLTPQGQLTVFAQRRHKKRPRPNPDIAADNDGLGKSPNASSSQPSRSWADDTLDQSFLEAHFARRKMQSTSSDPMNPGTTPPMHEQSSRSAPVQTLKLNEVINNRETFQPAQYAATGIMPGGLLTRSGPMYQYLTKNWILDLTDAFNRDDFPQVLENALWQNAKFADNVGQHRLAQSWRIVSEALVDHLKRRVKSKQQMLEVPIFGNTQARLEKVALSSLVKQRDSGSSNNTAVKPNRENRRPVSVLGQQLASESKSTQSTPVVRPVGNIDVRNIQSKEEDDHEEAILPSPSVEVPKALRPTTEWPPPASPTHFFAHNANTRRTPLTFDDSFPIRPKLEKHDSSESFAFLATSAESSTPASHTSDGSGQEKGELVKERLSRPQLGSLSGQSETSARALEVPVSRESLDLPELKGKTRAIDMSRPLAEVPQLTAHDPYFGLSSYPDEYGTVPHELFAAMTTPDPPLPEEKLTVSAQETDRPSVEQETVRIAQAHTSPPVPILPTAKPALRDVPLHMPTDNDPDVEEGGLFTLEDMLKELLAHCAKTTDAQTAAHLVCLICPLLPRTHPLSSVEAKATVNHYYETYERLDFTPSDIAKILDNDLDHYIKSGIQPLQVEAILSTYHYQLADYRKMHVEAAQLRNWAYPLFPAVWENHMHASEVGLACGACGSSELKGRKCCDPRCSEQEIKSCSICWCHCSPFTEGSVDNSGEGNLQSACLRCGHGGHAACLRAWFSDGSDGGAAIGLDDDGVPRGACPTEGCMCDCGPGSWREEKAKMKADADAKTKNRGSTTQVKKDDWGVGQSGAVDRAGKLLGTKSKGLVK